MADLIYFNGVRSNGEYGLKPLSEQALVDHIFAGRDAAEKVGERLQKQLERKTVDRLQDIVIKLAVRGLAQFPDAEGATEAPPATRDAWLDALAGDIVAVLVGETSRKSGITQELAAQLKQALEDTLSLLVAYLAKGQVKELTTFLLSPDPDMQTEFKEKLKRETDQTLIAIGKEALNNDRIEALSQADGVTRQVWMEELLEKLLNLQTPLQAMTALSDFKYIVTTPITTVKLGEKLAAIAPDNAAWQDAIAQINAVVAKGRSAAWRDLIDQALRAALQAFCALPGAKADWPALRQALAAWIDELRREIGHLGLIASLDPRKLNEAGWGVIFPARMAPARKKAIREVLEPLLCHRLIHVDLAIYGDTAKYTDKSLDEVLKARDAQGFNPKYQEHFKIYEGGNGYRPNDTARAFLSRHGARPEDPANPDQVPYYLLLVGTPEEIPFEFQYQLDVQYAVGRLDFDDVDDYRTYAKNVIAAENDSPPALPQMTLFGVQNPGDPATELSTKYLIQQLHETFDKKTKSPEWIARGNPTLQLTRVEAEEATKKKLLEILTTTPPALLFTASHGREFDSGDADQVKQQGALLCSDWPGPHNPDKRILPEHTFSGEDILKNRGTINARGMIAFFFACYGAGTPRYDEFTHQAFKEKGQTIAETPFVAALPKALLSAPRGALAVIGHVERAWALSFMSDAQAGALPVFESLVQSLLTGLPVGAAMEYFNVRYAALSTELTVAYDAKEGLPPSDREMAQLWTNNNDARGYIVLGDPAVRLRLFLSP
ncbi:MAG TPA: C25 family cysteine peptidase [Anaerolineae bacterium]|nr:C25 family cysteine peptidase [Anaerolineae bacterium]